MSHLLASSRLCRVQIFFSDLGVLGQDLWEKVLSEVCTDGGAEGLQPHHPSGKEDGWEILDALLRRREVVERSVCGGFGRHLGKLPSQCLTLSQGASSSSQVQAETNAAVFELQLMRR